MDFRLSLLKCTSYNDICLSIDKGLESYEDIFPSDKKGKILIKPNLNSNMNALTGNTTDLRVLSALILALKKRDYTNIVIGEGTNSGFYRNNISVISRLGVDRLAAYYGVTIKDLNQSKGYEISFDKGVKAYVAQDVMEARLLINLPKLKTHFENGMTVCLKNLIGCLVGQENKKKVHDNLAVNILKLNEAVKAQLHIVDALIAMEGLGPTKGVPVRMDRILAGTDPYLIDLVCSLMAGFDYKKIRTLKLAEEKGILTRDYFREANSIDLSDSIRKFAPPKAGPLARFIHSPKRQKFFLKIRNTPFFSYLASTKWFATFLYLTDLRQDVFHDKEMTCRKLELNRSKCKDCGVCKEICPLGIELPGILEEGQSIKCIDCLYCYSVCPESAIEFHGEYGFFKEQIKQYDSVIRKLYKKEEQQNGFF